MEESSILAQFDRLVESDLVRYDDQQETIEHVEGGLKFQFLLTSALLKKPTLQTAPPQAQDNQSDRREGSDLSTKAFEIGDIGSGTHFLAANKFAFARPHLMLLTTDGHQKQYKALHADDIAAAWAALLVLGKNSVAFYNCGRDGGCSRLHKHMQLMEMPKHSFASFLDSEDNTEAPAVPFHWFYHRFDSHKETVSPFHVSKVYTDLLEQATLVGMGKSEHAADIIPRAACPHNVIFTRRWMIVIPRRRAAINKEAGANALGMLGVIAVGTKNEMDNWLRLGLTEGLRLLGVPK